MTVYYVDDGGSATAPFDTWAKAATSLTQLDIDVSFASSDIVYIGHDHVCPYVHAATRTFTGPTTGLPVQIISATQGSDPPTYQASVTNQIDTSESTYSIFFDGAFALYGICAKSGQDFQFQADVDEVISLNDCTLKVGVDRWMYATSANDGLVLLNRVVIDLTADGSSARTSSPIKIDGARQSCEMSGLSFVNAGYRTGSIFSASALSGNILISSSDFSTFDNATACELFSLGGGAVVNVSNCKTVASPVYFSGTPGVGRIRLVNVGPSDDPSNLVYAERGGYAVSSSLIYRTSGAAVEGDPCSWLITTTANCGEGAPFYTPWMYGVVSSTGSKTFDCYITNDTADFTDAQVWLEVEYLATADDAKWTLATDQRATITTTAAAQDDDTVSAWNGTGPAFTYKQKLSVAATIGETGQYRARVAVGVASILSSRYFYVDPKITVS